MQNSEIVNARFNEDMQEQITGILRPNHVYKLGQPSNILKSAGIPDLGIELYAGRLWDKSNQVEHRFSLSDMKNLPNVVQNPLAVFDSATQPSSFVILTELKQENKNYIVALQMNKRKGNVFINDIRSVYPRDGRQIANWVNNGLMKYADKKRMVDWVSKQRCNSAEVKNLFDQSLNVINNFQNPQLPTNNLTSFPSKVNTQSKKSFKKLPEASNSAPKRIFAPICGDHDGILGANHWVDGKDNARNNHSVYIGADGPDIFIKNDGSKLAVCELKDGKVLTANLDLDKGKETQKSIQLELPGLDL